MGSRDSGSLDYSGYFLCIARVHFLHVKMHYKLTAVQHLQQPPTTIACVQYRNFLSFWLNDYRDGIHLFISYFKLLWVIFFVFV